MGEGGEKEGRGRREGGESGEGFVTLNYFEPISILAYRLFDFYKCLRPYNLITTISTTTA